MYPKVFATLAFWLLSAISLSANAESSIRIFMIGDSTMANKKPTVVPETGWGQVMYRYFGDDVLIENHAVNGRSSKSFRDEGRWEPIESRLQAGDFVIIQFGHNDEKVEDPTRYAAANTDYIANLKRYVEETRAKGAEAILATSICRRRFDEEGNWVPTHGDYPDAVRAVAEELDVPLVDMQAKTKEMLTQLGVVESVPLFMHVVAGSYAGYPKGKIDDTHLTEMGALKVCSLFLEGLREIDHPLVSYLKVGESD